MPMLVTPGPPAAVEPPADDHRRALDKDAFDCPRCGTYAHQAWRTINVSEGEWTQAAGQRFRQSSWKEAVCDRCDEPSVWRPDQMIYPLGRLGAQPHGDVPGEVRELYVEAASVAAVSRRAGAALARAMVERLIKILDPDASKKAKLDARIDRIRDRVSTPAGRSA